jgi:hypothetical protein
MPASFRASCATASRATTLYVVSLPPVTLSMAPPLQARRCSRDALVTSPEKSDAAMGRMPAQAAMTSSRESRAAGK